MTLVDLPPFTDMIYVNDDKRLSTESHLYNDQLWQILNDIVLLLNQITYTEINQKNDPIVKIKGINPPSYTTAEINDLSLEDDTPIGTIWYDSDIKKLKFLASKLPVVVETITSVP